MLVDKKQRLNRRWIASALTGSAAISIAARAPLSACFAGWTRYQLVVASAPRRANSSLLSHLHRRVRRRLPELLPLTARRGFHRWPRATCRRCFFPAPPSTANLHNPGNAAAACEGGREREREYGLCPYNPVSWRGEGWRAIWRVKNYGKNSPGIKYPVLTVWGCIISGFVVGGVF